MPQPDQAPLRHAARVIYDTVYPNEEWTPVPFEEAERLETVHYRNAVNAARFFQPAEQAYICVRWHMATDRGSAGLLVLDMRL